MSAQEDLAVRITNVSKIYRLWRAPKERLFFSLKRAWEIATASDWRGKASIRKLSGMQRRESLVPAALPRDRGSQEFYALNDVSFAICKGESWGIIGVNGSGKSTLLKIISGNLRPSMGRVEVDGKVAILDYGSGFNGNFTGKENIFIKGGLLGLTKKQISERYEAIVEFADIGDFINQAVNTYSSGMSARLGFAIMAHVEADIIITDEALAVGDIFFVQKCMRFIRSFLEKGTFLFVSHSMNDVLSLCQKAVWLEKGSIRAIGSAADVASAYLHEEALNAAHNHLTTVSHRLANEEKETKEIVRAQVGIEQPRLSQLMEYQAPLGFIAEGIGHSANCYPHNRIHVSSFTHNPMGINLGGAVILEVAFYDETGNLFSSLTGGEILYLTIKILAQRDLQSPIIGFQVLNSAGQVVFADNSYGLTLEQPVLIKKGTRFAVEFRLQMPFLPLGVYAVRAAIALGEKKEGDAVLLQTIDNALTLHCVSSSIREGLMGLAMHSVEVIRQDLHKTPISLLKNVFNEGV